MSGWDAHEFTAVAGTRMHAAVLGPMEAPEVVCVHGLGCSHRYFLPFARRMAPYARVVAVDLPGFGRSPGPPGALDVRGLSMALADWLTATGRGGAVLVGNSSGCQVVVDLAVHSPTLLGPVVLNAPTMDRRARTFASQLARLLVATRWERPTLGLVLARDYLDCGPRRLFRTLAAVLDDPLERKLGHVRTRALVVHGSRDPVVAHDWAREVADRLPNGRLVEVPGAGHTLNYATLGELARLTRVLLPVAEPSPR